MKLIDKDVLVEYIEQRYIEHQVGNQSIGCLDRMNEDKEILSYLNTLEVKEVDLGNEFDLNKEIDEQIRLLGGVHKLDNNSKRWYTGPYEELFHFARHFFELGLKVQKGE